MKIQIILNNKAISKRFSTVFGFSCLIDGHILFDTGEKLLKQRKQDSNEGACAMFKFAVITPYAETGKQDAIEKLMTASNRLTKEAHIPGKIDAMYTVLTHGSEKLRKAA